MGKTRPPYAQESRRQLVELVRSGRSPEALEKLVRGAVPGRFHAFVSPRGFEPVSSGTTTGLEERGQRRSSMAPAPSVSISDVSVVT